MRRRTFLAGAACGALFPRAGYTQARRTTRVLKFVPQADLAIVDPVVTTAYVTRHHSLMIWDQLYSLDSALRPQPQMVEGHTTDDGERLWTFRLREGLRFHDGEPVRGRDCIASIRRWAARDPIGQALMHRVDDMSAPEDRTFVIRLNRRFGLMLEALAKAGPPALCIMPERLAVSDPFQQIKEVIGSGPFKWVASERLAGARAVYERFDEYRPRENGTPDFLAGPKIVRFDRVEWHIITDPGTSAAALQTGEVDWWENPPNDLLPILERSPNVATERINTLGVLATGVFNCRHPPFDKSAVRRVVLEAMTQADYMTAVAGTDRTLWRDGVGLYPPGTPMASDVGIEAITRKRDLPALRESLRRAGYRGERVVLMAPADQPALFALSEVGRDLLRRLDIEVDYAVSSWGVVLQRRAKKDPPSQGGWSMFYTTWAGLDMLNPIVIQPLRANGDEAWFGWPNIPKIQVLLDQWTDAPYLATQQRIAAEIQGEALLQAPFIPVGQYFSKTAYNRSIKGIAKGSFVFWNVYR